MSTLWQSSNCFKSWYWTLAVGDLQQGSELEGGGGCQQEHGELSVREQRQVIFSSFCLLAKQCSRLWRRNSIFLLSLTVFLSPPHQPTPAKTIVRFLLSLEPSLPLFSLFFSVSRSSSFSRLRQSHRQHTQKNLLNFVGLGCSCLSEHCVNLFWL